jgi:hypothetical protein
MSSMVAKRLPCEAHFQGREQPKVTWSEIRRVRWLGDDLNAFLGEELLHNKRCVARRVVVMQQPSLSVSVCNHSAHICKCVKCSWSERVSYCPSKVWQSGGEWRNVAEAYPQMKKSNAVRSGERGAASVNPFPWKLCPTQSARQYRSRTRTTVKTKHIQSSL